MDQRALLSKGQIYEVAYKDLIDKPLSSLEEIYSTLNLGDFENVKPNMKEYLNSISNYKPNASKTIKPELLEKINKEWKFAFEEFNYEITND